MFVTSIDDFDEMGYSLSRLTVESDYFDDGSTNNGSVESIDGPNKPFDSLDHEVAQLTKLRSAPNERLRQVGPGRRGRPVSTVKMLEGREGNYSGRGRFSSADCCHVLGRYLPLNGPWLVDQMPSRAYVSQFSADGSLFVAGFQVIFILVLVADKTRQKNKVINMVFWFSKL